MKTLLHVNYYERPAGPEPFFKLADICAYDGVELRWKWLFPDLPDLDFRRLAAEYKDTHPEKTVVFAVSASFCDADSSCAIDEVLEFMHWARTTCGTRLLNFKTDRLLSPDIPFSDYHRHGSAVATAEQKNKIVAALQIIGREAQSQGMRIALETHNIFLHDTAGSCSDLIDSIQSPAVGVNYDYSNILLNQNGESSEEAMRILAGKIFYAHLKNLWPLKGCATKFLPSPAAYGSIDNRAILQFLQQQNCPAIALENPGFADASFAARQDLEYIRFIRQMLNN